MRIGIFGGSFNPIHYGHLLLAETAREALVLDRVAFIPAHIPPHKTSKSLLPAEVRYELVQLAIRDQPAFVASDIELQRHGPSYSIETVKVLHQQVPQAKLFLIIGQDMLAVKWAAWNEITRLCTVAAARRPGSKKSGRHAGIKWLEMPQMEISSTGIRKRIAAGRSIRYLVPPAVERFIRERGLYRKEAG
ncbi:MAG: nicotinate-nucleotide adenylyltransferase [Candidatus Omnitrophica bacterium]|nr:nicotinate-nucleotide adenylyltransferase [Candidatus Omnitrophota bacterium]